ncbi:hypothetical protein BKA70DRAFT_1426493 [Coprinopsis sp. MPI-PUGE-AT-0042]|nr:hypothetical protein BKA70DRAFT_1426493 [Coprinopsis sp. MPI-PUGE-AT-0042]
MPRKKGSTSKVKVTPADYSVVHAVPGYGKPLDYVPDKKDPLFVGKPLPSALSQKDLNAKGAALPLTTLREFSMLQFMNAITDKENWHVKILDDTITNKWKAEAIEAAHAAFRKKRDGTEVKEDKPKKTQDTDSEDKDGDDDDEDEDEDEDNEENQDPERFARWPFYTVPRDESLMSVAMADYCIAELRHKASTFEESPNGAIVVYNGDVVKSDTAVSPEVKEALRKAVAPLENVSENQKDWHPGSNEKVLDLVHPSLFPLLYGRSKVLAIGEKVTTLQDCIKRTGEGTVISVPDEPKEKNGWGQEENLKPYSNRFQWLPCEVDVAGDKPKIISYINNLHPKEHEGLYDAVEDVLAASIPLWETTLAPGGQEGFTHPQRIPFDGAEYDPDPDELAEEDGPLVDENDDDTWDVREDWKRHIRRTIHPEPEEFDAEKQESLEPYSLRERFGESGRSLQVIVKLANIELTPEKPDYEGGTWHVEGKLSEHIVATALYYYSSENITRSSLAFRQLTDDEVFVDFNYEQGVHDFLVPVYGAENEDSAVQEVGSVETREGRLLTFPNILQHQVQPFALQDKTKPGHRKILALFLVDSNIRVLSTAHVPPQQLAWWRKALHQDDKKMPIKDLPLELQDHVYDGVDEFPISLIEAKRLREELMAERKAFVLQHSKAFEASTTFSLCEH